MKLFLATIPSSEMMEAIEKSGHKNILISYFYLRNIPQPKLDKIMHRLEEQGMTFFLDSGAFSIRTNKKLDAQLSKMNNKEKFDFYADFTRGYIEFIKRYYKQIYCFAELDIDTVLGLDAVLELRKLFPETIKPKMCPVYHPTTRNLKQFKDDCDAQEYNAIGTAAESMQGRDLSTMGALSKYAYTNGNKLHGFALIDVNMLKALPFASADSSTWNSGVKFGHIHYFSEKEGRLKVFHYKNSKDIKKHLDRLKEHQGDFMKIWEKDGEPKKISRIYRLASSALAYHQLEEYLTRLWDNRGIKFDKPFNNQT